MEPSPRQSAAAISLLESALEAEPEETWWETVAEAIFGTLFQADVMTVNTFNKKDHVGWFSTVHPSPVRSKLPLDSTMDSILTHDHPFSWDAVQRAMVGPLKVTDVLSPTRWRNSAACDRMRELTGAAHHLAIPLTVQPGFVETVSVVRADGDFRQPETALARQLMPILRASCAHIRLVRQSGDRTSRNSAQAMGVTDRELSVLRLLDEGLSTNGAGRELGISPRTVYKHQQNLYRKLGVNDRLNALRRARECLLLNSERPQVHQDSMSSTT